MRGTPWDTKCRNDIRLKSMRQDDVTLTSVRHHFDVPCLLGLLPGSSDRSIYFQFEKQKNGRIPWSFIHHRRGSCFSVQSLQCIISVYLSFHTRLYAGFIIVYTHGLGRRLCSNWFWHGSTAISYPQCILTFMLCWRIWRACYLHRYHKLFAHMPWALLA